MSVVTRINDLGGLAKKQPTFRAGQLPANPRNSQLPARPPANRAMQQEHRRQPDQDDSEGAERGALELLEAGGAVDVGGEPRLHRPAFFKHGLVLYIFVSRDVTLQFTEHQ